MTTEKRTADEYLKTFDRWDRRDAEIVARLANGEPLDPSRAQNSMDDDLRRTVAAAEARHQRRARRHRWLVRAAFIVAAVAIVTALILASRYRG